MHSILISYNLFYMSLRVLVGSKNAVRLATFLSATFSRTIFHSNSSTEHSAQTRLTLPRTALQTGLSLQDRQLPSYSLAIPKECLPLQTWPRKAHFMHRCCLNLLRAQAGSHKLCLPNTHNRYDLKKLPKQSKSFLHEWLPTTQQKNN